MAQITPIKLCEFKRLVEHGHQLNIVAQQQASGGFLEGRPFQRKAQQLDSAFDSRNYQSASLKS
ncbi:hypothetical protein ACS6BV_003153 [Vibrio alginolyticus]|nr:hypothetical protein [Vibrio alginolyticus]EGR0148789.1 hypothetical protein [Vibrio alginolyticus]EHA1078259.1 hypothetical protein [Vibrio alginolyticus]EHA1136700.1 hypothetical protein [Vibrio alginolyticus]EJX1246116.1 hypothetical protein [Vibrio alginolyticus]